MKSEFMAAINTLCNEKGVPRDVVMEAIESALVTAYRRNVPNVPQTVIARVDPETAAAAILVERTVVEESSDDPNEISLAEAHEHEPNAEIGQTLTIDVTPPQAQLGRIAAQTFRQVVVQKLREAERRRVYDQFTERQGEILHGLVQRIEQGTAIIELEKTEALMPRSEQIPTERYHPGQRLRVVVVEVHDGHKGPQVTVSRAHRLMLRRLFEQEVPEIFNGTVEIKAISREPGARAKVAVAAQQDGIDPVGSCVGMRGVRIQNIVSELNGEKIDVVQWDADPAVFVAHALSPAQVVSVEILLEENTARVIVPERQLSLAIGKEGQNARLAAKLTGWRIDIRSDAVPLAPEDSGQPEVAATEAADATAAAPEVADATAAATDAADATESGEPAAVGAGESSVRPSAAHEA